MTFTIGDALVAEENRKALPWLEEDYAHLARQLARRGADIERLVERAAAFRVSVPSWGVGTGGTRFARFAGPVEPRNVFEKLEDCDVVQKLVLGTPRISLHIPSVKPDSAAELRSIARQHGRLVHIIQSHTFQVHAL